MVESKIIDRMIFTSKRLMAWASRFKHMRYLFNELKSVDREYFIGIKGMRGVGKTVLMLQLARETKNSVYFSADSTFLKPFGIYEVVDALKKRGFENIFIDEIHRKAEWDADVKTIYDEHEVRIIFSGSSAIDITHTSADLSRRVVLKELRPVSFREFLNIRKNFNIPALPFKEILENRKHLAVKYAELHKHFDEYLEYGGVLYPKNGFYDALENAIRKVIFEDLASMRNINVKYENDVYKFLYFVATSPPFETNYSSISNFLQVSKSFAVRMVEDIRKTGLIIPVFPCAKKGVDVKKEPKLYLTIPIRKFFEKKGVSINVGALREEFFVNHMRDLCYLKGKRGEKTPDFRVNNIIIEIGGESKSRYQKPDYLCVDGLSTENNRIPLFLFGLVY